MDMAFRGNQTYPHDLTPQVVQFFLFFPFSYARLGLTLSRFGILQYKDVVKAGYVHMKENNKLWPRLYCVLTTYLSFYRLPTVHLALSMALLGPEPDTPPARTPCPSWFWNCASVPCSLSQPTREAAASRSSRPQPAITWCFRYCLQLDLALDFIYVLWILTLHALFHPDTVGRQRGRCAGVVVGLADGL